jgi:ABC-type transport system involved in cytochrome bd biosynthesis fused ATPase/permease subunit
MILVSSGQRTAAFAHILLQDEATSNVDVQLDAKVQLTIQSELKESTLLCIAHRLNTIGKSNCMLFGSLILRVDPQHIMIVSL